MIRHWLLLGTCLLWPFGVVVADTDAGQDISCPPAEGIALQVLGSGGPIADDGRASSAYLVWKDGRAMVLIDAGSGAFLRFGESGARFKDLEIIALSHFHTDHSAALPALLKSGYFSDRERPLFISGPAGGGPFPGLPKFLDSLLEPGGGAYGYLGGYLEGNDGLVKLETVTVNHKATDPQAVLSLADFRIDALGVPHGIVPSLAYRVRLGGKTLVFGSDQTLESDAFVEFARGADLLVVHLAISENSSGAALRLHARPSQIGAVAGETDVNHILLSHFMARSLHDLESHVSIVRKASRGNVSTANDLDCFLP